ncbi:hydrogenase maturation nickel metallochaperone HypA [Opitutus terrae]|uniref:Hydrogenase maturation factor HypA n=1 Tax=Opitutus terrae (strain DSM 11246 / JCM 15787 / PB90-1) TaxID=452637 RepID=B1ZQ62_OPITP|nr:hydrogenase maturation nickel metallochaperone HypA [Opitutus terrae]ACB77783.1 hydrogenase nickel insertion protein HypA [Opitutus terrae PB90-1]
MHEFGLAESALQSALAAARDAHAAQVLRVVIRIGELSGVDAESFRFAFASIRAGTPASEAELEIEAVPAKARCGACGRGFSPADSVDGGCPHCGSPHVTIAAGRELDLVRLEVS